MIFFMRDVNHVSGKPVFTCNQKCLEQRLRDHIHVLSEDIGERHHENPGSLDKTLNYIEQKFIEAGLQSSRHSYAGGRYHNLIAEVSGRSKADEIIIIGAHYDTVWLSPGADDNASGVAVMLELAHAFTVLQPERTVRFIAFANEENPFAETDAMGSRVYVRDIHTKDENVVAMFSLEMLGYYSDAPGSQKYPPPLKWFYPDQAGFIAFVTNVQSGWLLWRSLSAFRRHSDFPVEGLAVPERMVPDIRRSDQASFWDAGYPAIMVTDTADFRNIHYHTVGDILRTLDLGRMAELTESLVYMFADLAGVNTGE